MSANEGTSIRELLDKLAPRNRDIARLIDQTYGSGSAEDLLPQVIHPAVDIVGRGVPTLKPGIFRPMTPMLQSRFEYAGTWENAFNGHSMLSLDEMEKAWTDDEKLYAVSIRQEHWKDSPPAIYPSEHLSLFAHNIEGEEIYLIWPDSLVGEPRVWTVF